MNSLERINARLLGRPVDRPPNFDIFMAFAAHHIHQPLSRYYQDYRVLVNANLAMADDFQVDILQAISDPYREATGFGLEVEFPEDGLPVSRKPLLASADDLQRIKKPEPGSAPRMLDRLEAVRLMRQRSLGEIPVMGWVEGALAEAADLRGSSNLLVDLIDRPEWLLELLEVCAEVEIDFAEAQVRAGAQLIGLGDAIASQVSPAMYRKYALPYEQRIFSAVHELGALCRLHICGNTSRIVAEMIQSGADIIDLDWMVDMHLAGARFGDQVALCGNLNPVTIFLQGTPDQVYLGTLEGLQAGGPRSFSAAGCEIPDGTPDENLQAQIRALNDFPGC